MTGLYLHIPFCNKKCHYCDFVITTGRSNGLRSRFIECLEKESLRYERHFTGKKFETFYIGGGTPSVLTVDELGQVFGLVYKYFKFKKNAEITCEINPGDLDKRKAVFYKKLGINRASLGAQSFNDKTLKAINRDHSPEDTRAAFKALKEAGIRNVSLDLMLSLPGETLEDVKHSLDEAVRLKPDHISLYELTIEEKTVFGDWFRKGTLKVPEEREQLEMLSFARSFLKKKGYIHYELLSYAKKGFESRHNLLYWANKEYLGLGPGAFSYIDGRRFRYSSTVDEYFKKIDNKDWKAYEEETLSADKKEIESFLLALRLREGAQVSHFKKVTQKFKDSISELTEKGLIEKTSKNIRLTPQGQFFAETVFSELSG